VRNQSIILECAYEPPADPTILARATQRVLRRGHRTLTGRGPRVLDTVYLPLRLPEGTGVRMVTYGMPRVGNRPFANHVDVTLPGNVTHVNNKKDPIMIPTVPWRFMGFVHPAGEVHIQDSGAWVACEGQDDPSPVCVVGDEPDLLHSNIFDHLGPYDHEIMMGLCS
jgi:hypothetical protein